MKTLETNTNFEIAPWPEQPNTPGGDNSDVKNGHESTPPSDTTIQPEERTLVPPQNLETNSVTDAVHAITALRGARVGERHGRTTRLSKSTASIEEHRAAKAHRNNFIALRDERNSYRAGEGYLEDRPRLRARQIGELASRQ